MIAAADPAGVIRGAWVQYPLRTLVALLAIALGVALGYAVHLVNRSAVTELEQGVRTLSGDADLVVRGPRSGFTESIYPLLANDPAVAVASPVIEADLLFPGRDQPLRVYGVDAFRAAALQPAWRFDSDDALDLLRPDALFLSPAALAWLAVKAGEPVVLRAGLVEVPLRVAGVLEGAGGDRLAMMDIAGAQVALARVGVLSRIDLRLRPGMDTEATRERLQAALPAGVSIAAPLAQVAANERLSRSYRVNLTVLALVALFTGSLVVFSTQALSVVARRTQFALMRTLGMTRRELTLRCMIGGALLGLLGAIIGLALGVMLAQAALRVVGPDLGAGFFRGLAPSVVLDPLAALGYGALGVLAAVAGTLLPAREAARAPVARALKAGDEEQVYEPLRSPVPGIALILLAGALLPLPAVNGLPLAGYAAIACLLCGALLLMPVLVKRVLGFMPLPRSAVPALALSQMRASSGRVGASLAAVVASIALMASMAVMVHSFRGSLDRWLERILPAPLYLRAPGAEAFLDEALQGRLAALPGVERIELHREDALLLDAKRPRVVMIARPLAEAPERRLPFVAGPLVAPGSTPALYANEAMAALYGFEAGRTVELALAGRNISFFVAGVWRDYARPHGAVQIDRMRYVELTGDRRANAAAVWLARGAEPASIQAAIEVLPGAASLEVARSAELRELSLSIFDRTFAVTYALELAAVVIGLIGMSSAFSALVLARKREFGVLRHLGLTRSQVAGMLGVEGAVSGTIGVTAGLLLGVLIAWVLIEVVNRLSFHWGMEAALPFAQLALLAGGVIAIATFTAVASGRRAMSEDAIRAVKEDW